MGCAEDEILPTPPVTTLSLVVGEYLETCIPMAMQLSRIIKASTMVGATVRSPAIDLHPLLGGRCLRGADSKTLQDPTGERSNTPVTEFVVTLCSKLDPQLVL